MATFVPYTTLFRSRTSTGQEKIMSADKHKNLAIRAGYLRASSSEGGLGLNIKWARKLTPFLIGMIKDGEIVQLGRAHVCTPVTNAQLVCRLLLEKKHKTIKHNTTNVQYTTTK